MHKTITLATGTFLLAATATMASELPREGDFKVTFYGVDDKAKFAETPNEGGGAWQWVETMVHLNDAGAGFLHEAIGRCLGQGFVTADGVATNKGFCASSDPDGDQIYGTFENHRQGQEGPLTGTVDYTGGTGKYAGLTGHAEVTVTFPPPLDKDMPEVVLGRATGHYKIQPITGGAAKQ